MLRTVDGTTFRGVYSPGARLIHGFFCGGFEAEFSTSQAEPIETGSARAEVPRSGAMILAKILLDSFWANVIFGTTAFVLGACIGSFLNVVIYRVPREMSVGNPRRSFCPSCRKQLPMYLNIPLVSWVMLRGKCRFCGAEIAARYFVVELVTAIFFLAIWWVFPMSSMAVVYWILASLLLAATFIDLEHYMIPDEITIGGAVAGVVCAAIVPQLMGMQSHFRGFAFAVLGAAAGYVSLWLVVQFGKLAFGRVKESFEKPRSWSVHQPKGSDEPELALGEEKSPWSEFFCRPTDKIIFECETLKVAGRAIEKEFGAGTVRIFYNRVEAGGETILLADLDRIDGTATKVVIPREAMGFGDVKFMAMIGAFLGWQAVLFTILAGSVTGAVVGLVSRVTGREAWGAKIPFGPFLALGAVIWLWWGTRIWGWYFSRL